MNGESIITPSSSFTKSNSLAATSIIPFTTQVDKEIRDDCQECMGTGYIPQTGMEYIKVETTFDENLNESLGDILKNTKEFLKKKSDQMNVLVLVKETIQRLFISSALKNQLFTSIGDCLLALTSL